MEDQKYLNERQFLFKLKEYLDQLLKINEVIEFMYSEIQLDPPISINQENKNKLKIIDLLCEIEKEETKNNSSLIIQTLMSDLINVKSALDEIDFNKIQEFIKNIEQALKNTETSNIQEIINPILELLSSNAHQTFIDTICQIKSRENQDKIMIWYEQQINKYVTGFDKIKKSLSKLINYYAQGGLLLEELSKSAQLCFGNQSDEFKQFNQLALKIKKLAESQNKQMTILNSLKETGNSFSENQSQINPIDTNCWDSFISFAHITLSDFNMESTIKQFNRISRNIGIQPEKKLRPFAQFDENIDFSNFKSACLDSQEEENSPFSFPSVNELSDEKTPQLNKQLILKLNTSWTKTDFKKIELSKPETQQLVNFLNSKNKAILADKINSAIKNQAFNLQEQLQQRFSKFQKNSDKKSNSTTPEFNAEQEIKSIILDRYSYLYSPCHLHSSQISENINNQIPQALTRISQDLINCNKIPKFLAEFFQKGSIYLERLQTFEELTTASLISPIAVLNYKLQLINELMTIKLYNQEPTNQTYRNLLHQDLLREKSELMPKKIENAIQSDTLAIKNQFHNLRRIIQRIEFVCWEELFKPNKQQNNNAPEENVNSNSTGLFDHDTHINEFMEGSFKNNINQTVLQEDIATSGKIISFDEGAFTSNILSFPESIKELLKNYCKKFIVLMDKNILYHTPGEVFLTKVDLLEFLLQLTVNKSEDPEKFIEAWIEERQLILDLQKAITQFITPLALTDCEKIGRTAFKTSDESYKVANQLLEKLDNLKFPHHFYRLQQLANHWLNNTHLPATNLQNVFSDLPSLAIARKLLNEAEKKNLAPHKLLQLKLKLVFLAYASFKFTKEVIDKAIYETFYEENNPNTDKIIKYCGKTQTPKDPIKGSYQMKPENFLSSFKGSSDSSISTSLPQLQISNRNSTGENEEIEIIHKSPISNNPPQSQNSSSNPSTKFSINGDNNHRN